MVRLPVQATLIITNRCNLFCTHCYTSANERPYREMTTHDWQQAIRRLASLPVFQVYIGGGEPFVRNDCVEILKFAHDLGVVVTTSTNGTFLSQSVVESLPASVNFQISIDGFRRSHEVVRGPGSFEPATRAARLLKSLRRPFCIGTVATAANKDELAQFHQEVICDIKPDLWHVLRLQPVGRGFDNYQKLGLSNNEWTLLVQWLRHIRLDGFPVSIDSSYDLNGIENLHSQDAWFYWRDIGVDICVWPNGDITPSDLLHEPKWRLGNIRDTHKLADVIQSSPVLHYLWNAQNSVRGKCTKCKAYTGCRGGSRTVALALTGDITSPDPFCPHDPPNRYAYE